MAETDHEPDLLCDLHNRLVAGDRTASEQVARKLLEPIVAYLRGKFPYTDDHLLQQAAADSVLDYCENPSGFNPKIRKGLQKYVEMIAWRDAANLVRNEKRQKRVQQEVGEEAKKTFRIVAVDPLAGKLLEEGIEAYVQELPAERDRAFMRLVSAGDTDVERLAASLGFERLPLNEMKREVKKAKDRIRATLRRKGLANE